MSTKTIDGHIHFHKQAYTLDLVKKMVLVVIMRGIDEIYLLDHTHKFVEFEFLYQDLEPMTKNWYLNKKKIKLQEYLDFVKQMKNYSFPIKVHFGLEVCYFSKHEEKLKKILKELPLDFYIGSIHFIDDWAFDLDESLWKNKNIDEAYETYYQEMNKLVESDLFDILAHPDSIKRFGQFPNYDLTSTYEKLCELILKHNIRVENNSGLLRFNLGEIGMNEKLYQMMKKYDIKLHKASDAHLYSDIGRSFDKIKI